MSAPRAPLVPHSAGWLGAPGLAWRCIVRAPLVASYPKAGRTWLRVMLGELGVRAQYTHFGAGVALGLPVEALEPRRWWVARRPTLLLLREPRDTLVSSFHQAKRRRGCFDGSLSEFVRDPRFSIEKVARWSLLWAELARVAPQIAIVTYEGLRAEGPPLLGRAARWLGAAPSDAQVQAAWEHGSFAQMRASEQEGRGAAQYGKRLAPGDPNDPDSFKVRRGKIGGHRDELSAEDLAYCEEALARLGYEAALEAALKECGLGTRG